MSLSKTLNFTTLHLTQLKSNLSHAGTAFSLQLLYPGSSVGSKVGEPREYLCLLMTTWEPKTTSKTKVIAAKPYLYMSNSCTTTLQFKLYMYVRLQPTPNPTVLITTHLYSQLSLLQAIFHIFQKSQLEIEVGEKKRIS